MVGVTVCPVGKVSEDRTCLGGAVELGDGPGVTAGSEVLHGEE